MQTAGLSDRELAPPGVVEGSVVDVGSPFSHDSISEPCISDHWRFSLADSTALLAASAAAPSSWFSTNFINCQEWRSKQNYYDEILRLWIIIKWSDVFNNKLYIIINLGCSETKISHFGYFNLSHTAVISNGVPKMGYLLHLLQEIRWSSDLLGLLDPWLWRC